MMGREIASNTCSACRRLECERAEWPGGASCPCWCHRDSASPIHNYIDDRLEDMQDAIERDRVALLDALHYERAQVVSW